MPIERRDFIKSGFAGLSFRLLDTEFAHAQAHTRHSTGTLDGGTGSVHVEGRLNAGVLTVEAQDFSEAGDRCLIMKGKLAKTDLYCSMFSYKNEEAIFAVLSSNSHKTSLLLSNSDDPKIAHLVVWNDAEGPGAFRIEKDKFVNTKDFKGAILDGKGESLDLAGKRNPPQFTLDELEKVFGADEALNDFMRGHRSRHDLKTEDKLRAFFCYFVSNLPGALYGLAWIAGPPPYPASAL